MPMQIYKCSPAQLALVLLFRILLARQVCHVAPLKYSCCDCSQGEEQGEDPEQAKNAGSQGSGQRELVCC